jgi:hypothetical protein
MPQTTDGTRTVVRGLACVLTLILLSNAVSAGVVTGAGSPRMTADSFRQADNGHLGEPSFDGRAYSNSEQNRSQSVEAALSVSTRDRRQSATAATMRDVRQTSTTDDRVPWGIRRLNGRAAARAVDESGVDIAVLDSGVDLDNPEFEQNLVWGVDTGSGTEPIQYGLENADDDHGHGTGTAGFTSAEANGVGVVGMAPEADLYSIRVAESDPYFGYLTDSRSVKEGIEVAMDGPDGVRGTDDDADVLIMSLGIPRNPDLNATIENASDEAVLVAGAGNSGDASAGTQDVIHPARFPGTIAVGGTNFTDGLGRFRDGGYSADGPAVDIVAPATNMRTLIPANGTAQTGITGGTSTSTPLVGGIAALLVAKYGDLSTDEARRILQENATDLGPPGEDRFYGAGIVTATDALGVDPPAPVVTGVSGPESVSTGEQVPVEVTLTRPRSWSGPLDTQVNLTVDGSVVASKSATIGVQAARATVPFDLTFDGYGEKTVSVEGSSTSQTVEVGPDGGVNITTVSVPDTVVAVEDTPIEVGVNNTAPVEENYTVELDVDGSTVTSTVVTVPANGETTVTLVHGFAPGQHDLRVGNVSTTVDVAPAIRITEVDLPADGSLTGTKEIVVNLQNVLDQRASKTVSIEVGTLFSTDRSVTLDAGDSGSITVRTYFPAGITTVMVGEMPYTVELVTGDPGSGSGSPPDDGTDPGAGPGDDTGSENSRVNATLSVDGPVVPNQTVDVTITVENTGVVGSTVGAANLTGLSNGLRLVGVESAGTPVMGGDGSFDVGDRVAFGLPGVTDPPVVGANMTVTMRVVVAPTLSPGTNLTATGTGTLATSSGQSTDRASVTFAVARERQEPEPEPAPEPEPEPETGPARFDENDDSEIQVEEVLDAIVAYNAESTVSGQPVTVTDVVDLIVAYNADEQVSGRA